MELLHNVIKISLPNYLKDLPIPDSFIGIFKLGIGDCMKLLPFFGTLSFGFYISYRALCPFMFKNCSKKLNNTVNPDIDKTSEKVVNIMDIEDINKKTSFCRCWRSKKFPLCDGSHNKHNIDTGDNVGPLVLKPAN